MRPLRPSTAQPDLLSRALFAHALAADRRQAAVRVVAGLRERERGAELLAAASERLSRRALARGRSALGLALDDAAREARRAAAESRVRLGAAERRALRLARTEGERLGALFRELCRFAAVEEGR